MKRQILNVCLLMALLAIPLTTSWADHTIWMSPLPAVSGVPGVTITQSIPSTSIRVMSASTGDYKWIDIPLALPSDLKIDNIHLCYELASSSSFISQVRLTSMTTPDVAWVRNDDGTDITDPGPNCVIANGGGTLVDGSMTLSLRLYFSSSEHWIDIGGIGLMVSPVSSAVEGDPGYGGGSELALQQNHPNPFGQETVISYTLERASDVELQILDVNGRMVRELLRGTQGLGDYRISWDGRDDLGVEVPAGTYYYHVRIGDQEGSRGMVRLH